MQYTKALYILALLSATASAKKYTFYFGIYAGEMADGTFHNPTAIKYSDTIIFWEGGNICKASGFPSQEAPSTNPEDPWTNWCDKLIKKDGHEIILDKDGPCGKDVKGGDTIDEGHPYADVLDRKDNNRVVGQCTFQQNGNSKFCGADGGQEVNTSIKCEVDIREHHPTGFRTLQSQTALLEPTKAP